MGGLDDSVDDLADAAWSGSGCPASSQAMTASTATVGSKRAAQRVHGPSEILSARLL
jgi:hypothetical protein